MPDADWEEMPIIGLKVPKGGVKYVPKEVLQPKLAWAQNGRSEAHCNETAVNLAKLAGNGHSAPQPASYNHVGMDAGSYAKEVTTSLYGCKLRPCYIALAKGLTSQGVWHVRLASPS